MGEENNIDFVNIAIAGVAATHPLLAFILMIGWHVQLFHVIPEKLGHCRGLIQKLTKRAEEKKDIGWKNKVALSVLKPIEIAAGILPEPPKNMEDVERILKFCNEKGDCINLELDEFLHGRYTPAEFIERIKNILGAKTSIEALDLYIEVKDLILDQKMFQEFDKIANLGKETNQKLEKIKSEMKSSTKELFNELIKQENRILALDEGFKWLSGIEFYEIDADVEDWLKGYPFNIKDIYNDFDYRRKIVDIIEEDGNYLIFGYPGYSKSTTLYRIMIDWYKLGYNVLYNVGGGAIEKPEKIIEIAKNLLKEKNHLLIAVDNIHEQSKITASAYKF